MIILKIQNEQSMIQKINQSNTDIKYKAGKPYALDMFITNANRTSVWVAVVNLAC